MSAILPGAPNRNNKDRINGSIGTTGIRRYKTRCKVLIDSHVGRETLELFEDVLSVDTGKTLKGAGQASVSLVPSKNYLNLIFPNDYINIYFDIGDGAGWTRTFFGFVDRVEEAYVVDEDGTPSTTYSLICTDFYKALERTMIYFNPHLAGRRDFEDMDYAKMNIGGLALMSKGIIAGGAPPDVISNILLLLLGFGTQFTLPSSYTPRDTQKRLREARANLVFGRLNEEALAALGGSYGSYKQLRADVTAEAAGLVSDYEAASAVTEEERLTSLAEYYKIPIHDDLTLQERTDKLIQLVADQRLTEILRTDKSERGAVGTDRAGGVANKAILDSVESEISSLSDILDVFTFVERRAMDGYMLGEPVWQKQGSLASILRSYSNEAINELFFDLRPLSAVGSTGEVAAWPVEGAYSTSPDDKQANTLTGDPVPDGITYIPALIMREYPFSTIEGLDLRNVNLELLDEQGSPEAIGLLYFGAIFNDRPNEAGRHVITVPKNLNIADTAEGKAQYPASKHLDVAVISEKEIMSTTLGRSDNDHFNLFEFYSDSLLGTDMKFYMRDMLPIITPIHILRNGIRVRSVTTRAARFSIEAIRAFSTEEFREQAAADQDSEEPEDTGDLVEVDAKTMFAPVKSNPDLVRFYNSQDQANWGYRPKHALGKYVFHQGIDISKRPLSKLTTAQANTKIPIQAIHDGVVVISCPNGGFDGYGNVVVIKHNFKDIGIRYSVYAHLAEISVGAGKGKSRTNRGARGQYCSSKEASGVKQGSKGTYSIKKGETVGFMGNTGFLPVGNPTRFHLHFEIDRHFPPRKDQVTPRISNPVPPPPGTEPYPMSPPPPYRFNTDGHLTSLMKEADQRSCDPVKFYQSANLNLQSMINSGAAYEQQTSTGAYTANDMGDNSPEEQENRAKSEVFKEEGKEVPTLTSLQKTSRDSVDTASSRSQIVRWALLQDHWYQHNLEYLSGGVTMRGAPEIRVGYRLDIAERNMSYYVEGVNHSWTFPDNMVSSLSVSRGQPNNPFPVYVYPSYDSMGAPKDQRRTSKSRLATYFVTPDPIAIRRSLFLKDGKTTDAGGGSYLATSGEWFNTTDSLNEIGFDPEQNFSAFYGEKVSPAGSLEYTRGLEEQDTVTSENFEEFLESEDDLAPVTGTRPDASIARNRLEDDL